MFEVCPQSLLGGLKSDLTSRHWGVQVDGCRQLGWGRDSLVELGPIPPALFFMAWPVGGAAPSTDIHQAHTLALARQACVG